MDENKSNITKCPNCEFEFDNDFEFCPNCGQKNKPLDLHFKYFIYEFLSGSFNLDSKIWKTFHLLLFYPGKLTKEFIAGRRASYIPPVRIYLIVSLVYFTILSFVQTDLVKFKDENNNVIPADSAYAVIEAASTAKENELLVDSVMSKPLDTIGKKDMALTMADPGPEKDLLQDEGDTIDEEIREIDNVIGNKLKKIGTKDGRVAFMNSFRKYVSIGMFVLMPVTALLFFMLFYKRTYYIQHLVFVLHLQSVMFIMFSVFNLIEMVVKNGWTEGGRQIALFVILFAWIKNFYDVKWWNAIWKLVLFLILFVLVFIIFMAAIVGMSAWNI